MKSPFAVYVHWPFCRSKCPYCDFNSHAAREIDQNAWRRAYIREIDAFADRWGTGTVSSVFFGGGTPSLMAPDTAAAVLDAIAARWSIEPEAEITLEANPTSVEAGRFRDFRTAGVNRVSIGVQSLDDSALRFLGRAHSAEEAHHALMLAARTFERYSFDLITARPGQTVSAWRTELTAAIPMARGHMSIYHLTIEPGTRFHAIGVAEADDHNGAALYDATAEILDAAGMPAYEISNHAAPGHESRHNLVYWRGGNYLGIGPGAHGRLIDGDGTTHALNQIRAPGEWLDAVASIGQGGEADIPLTREERTEEILMMGLRLTRGIEREAFRNLTGLSLGEAFDAARLRRLTEGGFLIVDAAGIRATHDGLLCLDAVLVDVVAALRTPFR